MDENKTKFKNFRVVLGEDQATLLADLEFNSSGEIIFSKDGLKVFGEYDKNTETVNLTVSREFLEDMFTIENQ